MRSEKLTKSGQSSFTQKGFSAFIIRLLGVISTMGISIFIGRTLGAEGTGLINFPNRVVSILSVLAMLGVNPIITRLIAVKKSKRRYQSVMRSALAPTLIIALLSSASLFILSDSIAIVLLDEVKYILPLKVLAIGLVFQVVARIYSAGLNGANLIWQSNLVNNSLSNFLTLLGLVLAWTLSINLDVFLIAVFIVTSRLIMLAVVRANWAYATRKLANEFEENFEINSKELLSEARPLYTAELIAIFLENVFIFTLSIYTTVEELGIFSICMSITLIFGLVLQVVISTMSPVISRLYSQNQIDELQLRVKTASGILLLTGMFSLIFVLFFGEQLLSIWGEEFRVGYSLLIILSIGQFVNLAAGLSGTMLVMTGFNKVRRNIAVVSMVFSTMVSVILISNSGLIGAGYAFMLSIIFDNIIKVIYTQRKVGIKSYFYV